MTTNSPALDMVAGTAAWADAVWRRAMEPEAQLTVTEWAEAHRILPPQSAEPGPWRTSRVPYLSAIMDALSVSSPFERVIVMAGSQLGKTEALLNALGYYMAHAPSTILFVQPSLDAVRRNVGLRIDPLIEHCPTLRNLVVEKKGRESGNSLFEKRFPGGSLAMTTAGSGIGLRSTPARFVLLDEVDAFDSDIDDEGDPVSLAVQRTVTYRGRRKIYLCSTPKLKGYSRIEAAYLESDQRRFELPCPACGRFATLEWGQIQWPERRRDLAYRVCPHEDCGGIAEERDKPGMLARGRWVATAEGDGKTVGFALSALYSPFETWPDIAIEHGQVYRDPPRLKTWTNNKLGLPFEDQAGEVVDADPLMERREDWRGVLPAGVVLLTAGIDTQGDRLELQVIGWGMDEESWTVDYQIFWGDPAQPQVWADLDAALQRPYRHARAIPDLTIAAACLDTGGNHTSAAYEFVRTRFGRKVWGIKGKGGPGVPLWPRRPSRSKGNVPLFIVGVDAAKDAIFSRLRLTESGPGCIHFPVERDANYFRQLTAEKVVTRYSKGRPVRTWEPKRAGERNEALDTFGYAMAALHGLISQGLQLNREAVTLADAPLREAAPNVQIRPADPAPKVFRSNWMAR